MTRLDRSAFFIFFTARFSLRLLPCFLFCPEGGALLAIAKPYAREPLGTGTYLCPRKSMEMTFCVGSSWANPTA